MSQARRMSLSGRIRPDADGGIGRGAATTNTGIVHPTVLLDGRIQAKWKKNGTKLTITPFCRVSQKNENRLLNMEKSCLAEKYARSIFNKQPA
ncbi:MAG: hypothetical protein LBS53_05525 [Synergistaceae bacterium]|jgi:hypothetical protein|nr:hypothetical protein [Synergistaceae bacterium]